MPDYRAVTARMLYSCYGMEFPVQDVQALSRFIPIANDDILQKSLKELTGAVKRGVPADFVSRLHRVYNRKVSELSRFYPALHVFETSYRSFICYAMADIYGTDDWWRDFHSHVLSLDTRHRTERPTQINARDISANVGEAVFDFVNGLKNDIEASKIIDGASTMQMMQFCYLRHLEQFITSDWLAFKDKFIPGKILTSTNFKEMFTSVRNARNSVFHHREIANRPRLISHLLALLDAIGVHLPSAYEDVLHHAGHSLKFEQDREPHHLGLLPTRTTYRLGDEAEATTELKGTCESEVIVNFLFSQKSTRIASLNSMKVEVSE